MKAFVDLKHTHGISFVIVGGKEALVSKINETSTAFCAKGANQCRTDIFGESKSLLSSSDPEYDVQTRTKLSNCLLNRGHIKPRMKQIKLNHSSSKSS